jgi:hypothetical protein
MRSGQYCRLRNEGRLFVIHTALEAVVNRSFGAACLLFVIGWSNAVLAQQRSIEVSWIEVHDEVAPRKVVSRHSRLRKFNLENDDTIVASSGIFHHNAEQMTINGTGLTRWRFDGANTLVREQFAPGYIRRVRVQIDSGGSNCHASLSFSPRSGTLYQMNRNSDGTGEALFLRSIAAQNVACTVTGHPGV